MSRGAYNYKIAVACGIAILIVLILGEFAIRLKLILQLKQQVICHGNAGSVQPRQIALAPRDQLAPPFQRCCAHPPRGSSPMFNPRKLSHSPPSPRTMFSSHSPARTTTTTRIIFVQRGQPTTNASSCVIMPKSFSSSCICTSHSFHFDSDVCLILENAHGSRIYQGVHKNF
jgi:hypothetical protein